MLISSVLYFWYSGKIVQVMFQENSYFFHWKCHTSCKQAD